MSRFGLTIDIEAVLADLDEIERVVPRQTQNIVQATATRYRTRVDAVTPVGPPRRGRRALRTGWQVRVAGPFRYHVVNTRPHAHLVESGFNHVSGRRVQGIDAFIPLAQRERTAMVGELAQVIGPRFQGRLRALQVTT